MQRTIALIIAGALIGAGLIVGAMIIADSETSTSVQTATDAAALEPLEINTAVVARKDFVEETEVDGTLGFGNIEALPNLASGVITWLPEPGTFVDLGDVLYEIDGRPVLLFEGDRPMHRSLSTKSSDGPDILRLETLLGDLGYADDGNLTVDRDFTNKTAEAIERWEVDLGLEESGQILLGTIVYKDEGFRISSVTGSVGQQVSGGSILSYSSTDRLVTVLLDTGLTGLLEEGQLVEVELPDDSIVEGTVTFVAGTVTTEGAGQQQTSYREVEIVLSGQGSGFDESPVIVRVEEVLESDATVVPIAALLALAEGGYAVEMMIDGEPTLTGISLGTFHNNEVAISGTTADIRPGDEVVIP